MANLNMTQVITKETVLDRLNHIIHPTALDTDAVTAVACDGFPLTRRFNIHPTSGIMPVSDKNNNRYVLRGKEINEGYNKSREWILKNALRELNHKRIKNRSVILKHKKEC